MIFVSLNKPVQLIWHIDFILLAPLIYIRNHRYLQIYNVKGMPKWTIYKKKYKTEYIYSTECLFYSV